MPSEGDRHPPFGLLSLATYLEKKIGFFSTKIIDKNFEDILKSIKEYKPDLVGISAMTIHYEQAANYAKAIKESLNVP